MLVWPDGSGPDSIVDDGGDATLLIHMGHRVRGPPAAVPSADENDSDEYKIILDVPAPLGRRAPRQVHPAMGAAIKGVTEETHDPGVHRLYEFAKRRGTFAVPGDQTSTTR